MGTASFFGIAVESCIKMLHVVRNEKKDIALRQAQDKLLAGWTGEKKNQTSCSQNKKGGKSIRFFRPGKPKSNKL